MLHFECSYKQESGRIWSVRLPVCKLDRPQSEKKQGTETECEMSFDFSATF